jgi:predicted metal-binding membrane protein
MRSSTPSIGAISNPCFGTGVWSAILIFVLSVLISVYFTFSMGGGMEMPGHWMMSMIWMTMPGQRWFSSPLMFLAMWQPMMIAMMLPSNLPMLQLFHRVVTFRGEERPGFYTWLIACGYFAVWLLFGVVAYLLGMVVAKVAMISPPVSRSIPMLSGLALVVSGIYQLTPWKSACLKRCRNPLSLLADHLHGGWQGALRLGLSHGTFCAGCCWSLMLIQLSLGMMNMALMVGVAVVIALEKLLAHGETIVRLTGVASIAVGLAIATRQFCSLTFS